MGDTRLAEYGRAFTFNFDLYEVDGVDFRVDAAHASGDSKIMKDEGAEGNTGSGFTDEGQSYSQVLTATEMQAKRITYLCVDQTATKVWLDKHVTIETFGHLSSAHPNLSPYWTNGAVNDVSASSSAWTFDGFTEATADHVIGGLLMFTKGVNAGQSRPVSDYTSTVITVNPAFLAAPADNDEFVISPRPAASALDWANGERLDALLDAIPTTAMRGTDSAALASEVTSARMSELDDSAGKLVAVADLIKTAADAIKLETDKLTLGDAGAGVAGSIIEEIENRPTTAMRGTDGVDTGTHVALVNLVWDELISEARTAGSYGQRLKDADGLDTLASAQVATLTDWINAGRLDAILDLIKTEADKIALVTAGAGIAGSLAEIILNIDTAAMRGTDNANITTPPTVEAIADQVWDEAVAGHVAAGSFGKTDADILVDTDELQSDNIPSLLPAALVSGRIDADVGAKTGNVALSAQEKLDVNTEVDTAFTTQVADSVPADGTRGTREQLLYMIGQMLTEFAISSTTMTIKKVDGSTTLFTLTLDDATNPTSITRAT